MNSTNNPVSHSAQTAREYIENADELLKWADQRLVDFAALITDHRFLMSSPQNRILFAVDFFDLLEFAFPFVNVKVKRSALNPDTQNDILRRQIARSCLLLNLGESYRPILLPSPYVEEFFSCLSSSDIVDPQAEPFDSRFRDLQKRLEDQLGDTPIDALEQAETEKLIELLIDLCPELFFIISGHFDRGLEVIRRMFKDNYVTMNFAEWGLGKSLRDTIFDGETFSDFDFHNSKSDKKWEDIFRAVARKHKRQFFSSWRADIRTIRFVKYLNQELNPHRILVLYVSGASMIETVFRDKEAQNEAYAFWLDESAEKQPTCFFRNLDMFGFYLRYSEGDPQNAKPDEIVSKVEKDVLKVQELTKLENRKVIQKALGKINEGEFDPSINTLDRQIKNVAQLRNKLFDSHTTAACSSFMHSYEMGNIHLLQPKTYADRNLGKYKELIKNILTAARDYQSEIYKFIVQWKIFFVNEFYGLVDVARLSAMRGDPARYFKKDFANFVMFPFRVKFVTEELRNKIADLCKIIEDYPLRQDKGDKYAREFYGVLSDLAQGCSLASTSENHFWKETISLTDRSEKGMERRLAWLVLLCALGYGKQVEGDAKRILEIADVPLKTEFRILHVQAGIRQLLRIQEKNEDIDSYALKVSHIVDCCKHWSELDRDPRFIHLAAFAAGTMARSGWLQKYDRNWVISRCREALNLIEEARSEKMDELERKQQMHLKQTVLANLSYYLAVDGDKTDVEEALRIHEVSDLKAAILTGLCMHNKGYIFFRRMELSETRDEIEENYDSAIECYKEAKKRLFGRRSGSRVDLDMQEAGKRYRQLIDDAGDRPDQ